VIFYFLAYMHVALVKMNFGNKLTPIEVKFGKVRGVFFWDCKRVLFGLREEYVGHGAGWITFVCVFTVHWIQSDLTVTGWACLQHYTESSTDAMLNGRFHDYVYDL